GNLQSSNRGGKATGERGGESLHLIVDATSLALQIAKLSFQAVSISRRLSLRVGEALGRPLGITECLVILLFVEFEPSIKLAHLQSQATHPAFFVASPRRYIVASCGSVIVRVSPPPLLFLCRRYAIALA